MSVFYTSKLYRANSVGNDKCQEMVAGMLKQQLSFFMILAAGAAQRFFIHA